MNIYLKKALANTSWLASEKVIAMLVNLVVSMALARSLGPEGFGTLNYLLAIIAIIKPLAALGLSAIVTRELVHSPAFESKIIATTVGLRFLGAIVGSAICLLIAGWGWGLSSDVARLGLVALGVANLFSAFTVLEFWFQAHMAAKTIVRMRTVVVLAFAVLKLMAIWLYADLLTIILLFSIESAFLGLGFVIIYNSQAEKLNFKFFDFRYGKSLLRQSFWLILSGVAAVIYLKIDQVMLEHLASTREVGIYAVAARLSEVWYFFADALVITLFPALLKSRKHSADRYYLRLQQVSDVLLVAALALSCLVMLVGVPVITLLYGSEYHGSATILQIHIWASLFVFMRAMVSKWLIAENLLMYSLVSHGFGALINIGANWLFIPRWGGEGAAFATVLSYFVASYLAFWISPKTRAVALIMTRSMLLPFSLGYRYWPQLKLS